MPVIEVDHVTKEYQLGQLRSLKQTALDMLSRLRGQAVQHRAPFKALDDVDFKVEQGEVVGIIGQNGAGKSTLLKILAGISTPTTGRVAVRGKVAPLIEVGAGLVPELTGRENIRLNASILGLKRSEIARKFDDIVAFSELEEFIDTPIKRYSSGMQVRLGFSIATAVDADILIVDEVLAVGDLAFQRKCFERMEEMIQRQGKTVLLVSHNIRQVERICKRVLLLDHGRMDMDGPPPSVCDEFYRRSDSPALGRTVRRGRRQSSGEINLVSIALLDRNGSPTSEIGLATPLTVRVVYEATVPLKQPVFGVGIHTPDFVYLTTVHTDPARERVNQAPGRFAISLEIPRFPFLPGVYCIRLGVALGGLRSTAFYAENVASFEVVDKNITRGESSREGIVLLDSQWRMEWLGGEDGALAGMELQSDAVPRRE